MGLCGLSAYERNSDMKRSEARREVMSLCFEYAFKEGESAENIYNLAREVRELDSDKYIRETFFGVVDKLDFVDEKILKFAKGWNKNRISPVALAVMRTAVYEMYFTDIPDTAALNEAIEIVKEYDDAKTVKGFVNGVLNSVLKEKEAGAAVSCEEPKSESSTDDPD